MHSDVETEESDWESALASCPGIWKTFSYTSSQGNWSSVLLNDMFGVGSPNREFFVNDGFTAATGLGNPWFGLVFKMCLASESVAAEFFVEPAAGQP